MRAILLVALVGLVLSGCVREPEIANQFDTITLDEARSMLRSQIGDDIIVSHAVMTHSLNGVPDGRSQTWLLEASDQAYEVRATGEVVEADPIPSAPVVGRPPRYAPCGLVGDSPPIATALAQSRAWREFDLANATPYPFSIGLQLSWEAECIGNHTVWKIGSSLVQNTGGTWSARGFWLDQQGRMAALFGDPGRGQPMSASSPTPDGINVERNGAFSDSSIQGNPAHEFEARNVVQLAIVASLDYQGIGQPLAKGTLVATGPSGEEYATAWAQDGARALYIPEANPNDAQGNWSMRLDIDSGLVPGFSPQFDICAGIIFQPQDDACQALYGFQNQS